VAAERLKMRIQGSIAILLFALLAGCGESPTGRRQLLLYSDDSLAEMGALSFAELRTHSVPSMNETVNGYIACVAGRLTAQQDGAWELAIINDETQLNAFALPGNKIGIYTGLLAAARDPAQLAAVVGHEIGHVRARHANERLSQQFATQAGLRLLYEAWTGGGEAQPVTAGTLALLGLGANVGILLPFSRAHEAEADQIGLMLMAEAGFDPRQSVTLWENMAAASEKQPDIAFLSTHPSHASRSQLLQQHMSEALARYEAAQAQAASPGCSLGRRALSPAPPPPAANGDNGRWQW
jgi:predicted Zn-dependent protease